MDRVEREKDYGKQSEKESAPDFLFQLQIKS